MNLHAVDTDQTQTFTYDALGRLETASGVFGSETYEFDEAGWPLNLAGAIVSYSVCGSDTCVTGAGADNWVARYDGGGRRVSFQDSTTSYTYEYDWRDKLRRVATHNIDVEYDAFGDHVFDAIPSLVSPGRIETRSFFGGVLVERTEGGKTQRIRNVDGPTGLVGTVVDVPVPSSPSLATVNTNRYAQLGDTPSDGLPSCSVVSGGSGCVMCGAVRYRDETWTVHGDLQGTPHLVTRATGGAAAARLFNAPFSGIRAEHSTGTNFLPSGFVGAPNYQAAIGGSSLGARFYDARTALFFTADELIHGGVGGEQGFNPYSYAVNNPIRYSDPLGLNPEDGPVVAMDPEYILVERTMDDEGYDPEPTPVQFWFRNEEDVGGRGKEEQAWLEAAAAAEDARSAAREAERFGPGVLLPKFTAVFYGALAGAMRPPLDDDPFRIEAGPSAKGAVRASRAARGRASREAVRVLAKAVGRRGLIRAKGDPKGPIANNVITFERR